jgi:hypothetical protein
MRIELSRQIVDREKWPLPAVAASTDDELSVRRLFTDGCCPFVGVLRSGDCRATAAKSFFCASSANSEMPSGLAGLDLEGGWELGGWATAGR